MNFNFFQARIDSGDEIIVGVNKYKPSKIDKIDVLQIDNSVVREQQIAMINALKAKRNTMKCEAAIAGITLFILTVFIYHSIHLHKLYISQYSFRI